MTLRPEEINHAFIAKLKAHHEGPAPIGTPEPDLANFPDRALAISGWTLGHFPRVDCMNGRVLAEGEESMIEQQRRVARESGWTR